MTNRWQAVCRAWRRYRSRRRIERRHPSLHLEPQVLIKGDATHLELGERVTIQSGSVLHLGGQPWCGNQGHIAIGADSVISPHCVIYGCGPGGVRIGARFDCGPGVGIFASRSRVCLPPRGHRFAPVRIGDDVTVFAHCVIGPWAVIGDRAVIAAGSVVNGEIPPDCLAAGSPARVIRRLPPA